MPLTELNSSAELRQFIQNNASAVVTFSAHWCGPCRASRPQLEQMANSSPVPMAIVHEDVLGGDLSSYGVRAFPTYVFFDQGKEVDRVEGANMPAIQAMMDKHYKKRPLTTDAGQRLGGSGGPPGGISPLVAALSKPAPAAAAAAPPADVNAEEEGAKVPATKAVEDPLVGLDPEAIRTLTEEMGFSLLRAQKALLYGEGKTVESALEWLMQHQDDSNIDEPIPGAAAVPKSYKCNDCGRILANMATLELHANKTGHSDFEESTVEVKPLTPEEKAKRIADIKELLRVKRAEREAAELLDEKEREKQRRTMGKEMLKTKEQLEAEQRKRAAEVLKKEKEAFKRERERLRQELAKDKAERQTNKGKLSTKLGVEGYNPDGIQYDVDVEMEQAGEEQPKKPKPDAGKIEGYIEKIFGYKAGGEGGKCLKVLKAYVGNLVDNPGEPKFRSINMDNNAFKTKVKPFIGAKNLLLAVGFRQEKSAEGGNVLVIDEDGIDAALLADTKEKLEKAVAAFG